MNQKLKHGILFFISLSLVVVSLYVLMPADNKTELKTLSFGYPFPFVTQDFSDQDASFSFFPRYERVEVFTRPIEHISVLNFILSWVSVFIVLEALILGLEWLKYKIRG